MISSFHVSHRKSRILNPFISSFVFNTHWRSYGSYLLFSSCLDARHANYYLVVSSCIDFLDSDIFSCVTSFWVEQNKTDLPGSHSPLSSRHKKLFPATVRVVAASSSNRDRNASVVMESTLQDMREGASVLGLDPKATVAGGVQDVYGEDAATEDQLVTPWSISVARWDSLLDVFSVWPMRFPFVVLLLCFLLVF